MKIDSSRYAAGDARGRRGFTLLELAVVLVVIGLVVGAILVGRDVIRLAQLRSVGVDVARYTQAVADFEDKYHASPGDFAGATALWGAAHGDPVTCETTVGTGTQTCDGNGDGRITTATITTAAQYEQFRAWQHLADAGMIDGRFTGVQGAAGDAGAQAAVIGSNVPSSRVAGAGFALISLLPGDVTLSDHYYPGINYRHIFQFGAASPAAPDDSTVAPALTAVEAQALDTKLDDGLPGTGKVLAPQRDSPHAPDCTTSDTAAAAYDLTRGGNTCSLIFETGF